MEKNNSEKLILSVGEKMKEEVISINSEVGTLVKDLIIPKKEEIIVDNITDDIRFAKPRQRQYFRTRPGELAANKNEFGFLSDNDFNRTIYIISPEVFSEFEGYGDCFKAKLVSCIDRQGCVFLWPLRVDKNSKQNSWNQSAREAAKLAENNWISRSPSITGSSIYQFKVAKGNLSDPEWPVMDFNGMLASALKYWLIGDVNHPVIRKIQGYE